MPVPDEARWREALQNAYPLLDGAALLQELLDTGTPMQLREGDRICELGQRCTHLALILRGQARVYELAESGREITLYRIGSGEVCILTASCIMSGESFPAIAHCEEALEVLLVPATRVDEYMVRYPEWRRFIWKLLADRLASVLMLLEEVTFRRLDERVMRYILDARGKQQTTDLKITHQKIADDLGSAREVVSRILKDMEQRNMLSLSRGRIVIEDHALIQDALQLIRQ